jgi:hypothetical protein
LHGDPSKTTAQLMLTCAIMPRRPSSSQLPSLPFLFSFFLSSPISSDHLVMHVRSIPSTGGCSSITCCVRHFSSFACCNVFQIM